MILDRPQCSWRECWSVVAWAEALGWNLPQRHGEISFERFALLRVRSVARDSLGSLPRAYARGYKSFAPAGLFFRPRRPSHMKVFDLTTASGAVSDVLHRQPLCHYEGHSNPENALKR